MRHHRKIARISFLLILFLSVTASANAQEAELWGWVIAAETNQPLVADVSIIHPAPPHVQFFHARTNLTGAYEMKGLPPGEKIVIARADGYGFAWKQVVLEPGVVTGPVDFALEKAATLEGQVVDDQGAPLAGATVRLAYKDLPAVTFDWQTGEVETDAEGNFRITSATPNCDFYLEASHTRFPVRLSETRLRAQPGETLKGAVLALLPGATFTGQVLDAAGNPVAAAEVRLIARRTPFPVPAGVRSVGLERELHRVVKTDARGQFTLQGLADGARRLLIRHPAYVAYEHTIELQRIVTPTVSLGIRLQAKTQ